MKMTQTNQHKQAALAELTIFLRKVQITRTLSDLDLLEVINSAGADLLSQTMQDQSATGIIPKIPAWPRDESNKVQVIPKVAGTATVDLAEAMDKNEAFQRWEADQALEEAKKQEAFERAMKKRNGT